MNKEFLYQNKKIFYRIIGNGKPVVFIHGFGEDGSVWSSQVGPPHTPPKEGLANSQPLLSEDSSLINKFKFIVPDLPGSGKSEMIDDMSIEGMSEVIKAIIDTESSKVPPSEEFREARASLIGHSMGGYITLAFAEKYPDYLNAFGLFHSTAYADTEEKKTARQKGIEFINQHGGFEFLKMITPNLFSAKTKDERPELIGQFINGLNNFSPAALVSYYKAMMQRPDRVNTLKKAAIPALFIIGEMDIVVPLQDSLKLCHLPEKVYIHILSESGHMGMLEEANKSNRILKNFLQET